jgi:hypothetical protein
MSFKEERRVSVELSRVKTSSESKYLVDLVLGAALIAVGVVIRALAPGVGGITPNVVIGTYCLAVMLLATGRKFTVGLTSALGVGLVAAVLCTLISKSEIIGINFISEPLGAIAGLLTFKALNAFNVRNKKSQLVSIAVGLILALIVYLLLTNGIFTNKGQPIKFSLFINIAISLLVFVLSKLALDAASFTPIFVAGFGTLVSGFTYTILFKILAHKPDAFFYGVLLPVVFYTGLVNMVLAQLLFGLVKAVKGQINKE